MTEPDLAWVRTVLADPGRVTRRARRDADDAESLIAWQARALLEAGLLAPDPLAVARARQEQAQRRLVEAENRVTRTTAQVERLSG